MIRQLPASLTNPYKKAKHSYFDDYDEDGNVKNDDDGVDPEVKQELQNNDALLPDNAMFEGSEKENQGDKEENKEQQQPKRQLVAIKKQKNIIGLDGLEFTLLREIKLL